MEVAITWSHLLHQPSDAGRRHRSTGGHNGQLRVRLRARRENEALTMRLQTTDLRVFVSVSASPHADRVVQLSQVQTALESDPDNAELQSLRDELSNLIDLTKQLNAGKEAQPSAAKGKGAEKRESPAQTHKYKPGEECTARYPVSRAFLRGLC